MRAEPAWHAEARKLKQDGLGAYKISILLDKSKTSVRSVIDPVYREHERRRRRHKRAGERREPKPKLAKYPPLWWPVAEALVHTLGLSQSYVSRLLDVDRTAVRYAVDPEYRTRRSRERALEYADKTRGDTGGTGRRADPRDGGGPQRVQGAVVQHSRQDAGRDDCQDAARAGGQVPA